MKLFGAIAVHQQLQDALRIFIGGESVIGANNVQKTTIFVLKSLKRKAVGLMFSFTNPSTFDSSEIIVMIHFR